jgi:hypothetical protein
MHRLFKMVVPAVALFGALAVVHVARAQDDDPSVPSSQEQELLDLTNLARAD